jgi:hypothetical protein
MRLTPIDLRAYFHFVVCGDRSPLLHVAVEHVERFELLAPGAQQQASGKSERQAETSEPTWAHPRRFEATRDNGTQHELLPVSRRAALSAHARDVSATVQPREKTLGAISSVRQIAPTVICSRLHASPFGHAVPPRRSKSHSNPARPASRSSSTEPVVALIGS